MPTLTVRSNSTVTQIPAAVGRSLLDALQGAGFSAPEAPCGGSGTCGKCRVQAEGLGEVLACRTRIDADMTVILPEPAGEMAVLPDGVSIPFPHTPGTGLGLAVDLGTTTVVVHLYDRSTGTLLATRSAVNAQRPHGADVISRIRYTMDDPDGLERLSTLIRGQIAALLTEACAAAGRSSSELTAAVLAGNTVMAHLYTGLSPASIACAPFTPLSLFGNEWDGAQLGLPGRCTVWLPPALAGYVGGDITAGLLSCGAYKAQNPVLFLDIGTNGEMALGSADRGFLCCAAAAGPAFEGACISQGMAACDGAISAVEWEKGALKLTVLGGGPAVGICGSGLVDALALLLKLGAVDETGRLLPPDEAPEEALPYLTEEGDGTVSFRLTDTVSLTGADVRQLQLAKAAIAAGIQTLLHESGLEEADVATLYLAGGFGHSIRIESAAAIGLLPPSLLGRIQSVGNTAGQGAAAALLSSEARRELDQLPDNCRYLELSGRKDFNDFYIECMMFAD